ncbi:MAG: hypothetical protein M3N43_04310 [Actinomycetota bacterium]|nr:hypothetical protein [Actinomycetota bacterium]
MLQVVLLTVLLGCASEPTGNDDGGPEAEELAALDDEFTGAASLGQWQWHHAVEGWPDLMQSAAIDSSGGQGQLVLEPQVSSWYDNWHGPLLFKEVDGDFDVVTRVDAQGLEGSLPGTPWSLTGLMARRPLAAGAAGWSLGLEDWVFITSGIGLELGLPVVETKTTILGDSELHLLPACAGWIDLRLVRAGGYFMALSRCPGEGWVVRARMTRFDLPPTMQVGLTAYSGYDQMINAFGEGGAAEFNAEGMPDGYPDLRAVVDFVRFRRPVDRPSAWWDSVGLATISDEDLVTALGEGAGS